MSVSQAPKAVASRLTDDIALVAYDLPLNNCGVARLRHRHQHGRHLAGHLARVHDPIAMVEFVPSAESDARVVDDRLQVGRESEIRETADGHQNSARIPCARSAWCVKRKHLHAP